MKKTALLFLMVFFISAGFATNPSHLTYVTVNGKTVFCKDLVDAGKAIKMVMENGETEKIQFAVVDAMMHDGRLFERVPVFDKNNDQICTSLMELKAVRNGLKLYRNCEYSSLSDCNMTPDPEHPEKCFLVYKDGKLHLRLDEKNAANVLSFFHIEVK